MRVTRKIKSDLELISSITKIRSKKYASKTDIFDIKKIDYNNNKNEKNDDLIQRIRQRSHKSNTVKEDKLNKLNNLMFFQKTNNEKNLIKTSILENNNKAYSINTNNTKASTILNYNEYNDINLKTESSIKNKNNNNNIPKIINSPEISIYDNKEEKEDIKKDNNIENKEREMLSNKLIYNKPIPNNNIVGDNNNNNNYSFFKSRLTNKNTSNSNKSYDIKTYCKPNTNNNSLDNNISIISHGNNIYSIKNNNNISFISNRNIINKNNINKIKLDDLILYEERLNDIIIALKQKNNDNLYDGDASNECTEFFVFYCHSSLRGLFHSFFNDNNKIIIESSNNLSLLIIIIIYHLSLNQNLLKNSINYLNNILSLMKINLYLIIKQLQIFQGEEFTKINYFYFKSFNSYLSQYDLINITKESKIIEKIEQNCKIIASDFKQILKKYQINKNFYFKDFISIFNNISIIPENEIISYFYNNLYGFNNNKNKTKINTKNKKIENDSEDESSIKSDNNDDDDYYEQINTQNNQNAQIINEYEKIKEIPPYIKIPNNKKYTLVLDLDETIINVEFKDIQANKCILHLRPGIFSFLNDIKPYYELITFTCASKQYAEPIVKEIEKKNKYFDYNFYREHSVRFDNGFVKDISRIGRDINTIIIVDNSENNFRLNKENGIKISPYYGNKNKNDRVLFELKKILILIYKNNYKDVRIALKDFSDDIKNKISLITNNSNNSNNS